MYDMKSGIVVEVKEVEGISGEVEVGRGSCWNVTVMKEVNG